MKIEKKKFPRTLFILVILIDFFLFMLLQSKTEMQISGYMCVFLHTARCNFCCCGNSALSTWLHNNEARTKSFNGEFLYTKLSPEITLPTDARVKLIL